MHPQTLPPLPGKHPPHIWRDGYQFWSLPELARRRGVSRQAASKWAQRHPELARREGKHTYARDETW